VPFRTRGIDPLNVHFSAHLVDAASGGTVTIPFSLLERRKLNDTETAVLELQVKDAPRGNYVLYVNIVDKASAARTSVHVPFTLQ
jgi:hypothetical protein